jgi:hypothetical protein
MHAMTVILRTAVAKNIKYKNYFHVHKKLAKKYLRSLVALIRKIHA